MREDEIHSILKSFHDEPYGGHFSNKRTGHKTLRMRYFWPTIFQDERKYVQACDNCQRMGQLNRLDEMPLQPYLVVEPFHRWALDFVGPINPPPRKKVYILVRSNYMTKWVEVVALVKAND